MADVARRAELTTKQMEALATAGAFGCFGVGAHKRRQALWSAEAVAAAAPVDRLEGIVVGADAPVLDHLNRAEEMATDIWSTGISTNGHPVELVRAELDLAGVLSSTGLAKAKPGAKVRVAGVVTHRQRPSTAGGVTFINLEDETGMINVICSPGVWARYRRLAGAGPALIIGGKLERAEGVTNIIAESFAPLRLPVAAIASRDFR